MLSRTPFQNFSQRGTEKQLSPGFTFLLLLTVTFPLLLCFSSVRWSPFTCTVRAVTWFFFLKSCRASGILGADDPFGDVSKSLNLFAACFIYEVCLSLRLRSFIIGQRKTPPANHSKDVAKCDQSKKRHCLKRL